MVISWPVLVCLFLGLASALVGGVFLAFSDFIMRGLGAAKTMAGVDAMQHINRVVYRSVFLTTFMALVPATTGWAIYASWQFVGPGRWLSIGAAGIYVIVVFLVTALGNVPMYKRLDSMASEETPVVAYWETYLRRWTILNHIRTIGSIATAICYFFAAIALSQ